VVVAAAVVVAAVVPVVTALAHITIAKAVGGMAVALNP